VVLRVLPGLHEGVRFVVEARRAQRGGKEAQCANEKSASDGTTHPVKVLRAHFERLPRSCRLGAALDLVGRQIGNYVAKKLIGRGGMGSVWLAEHPLIGRSVAVKVLHEELAIDEHMVQRLWLEAKSASEIDSEHIVEMLDFGQLPLGTSGGEQRKTVYLAMELLQGKSLADRFWEEGISFRDSVDIARQMCKALEASHQKGIVHRDLKPENIFLIERNGKRNFVKLLDFGIAKLVQNPYTRTRTGVLLGTPAYMSPEQCRGSGEVDRRSDVYSLGVVLYELVSGTVPFAAQGFGDVLVAQMTAKPEPPSTHNARVPKNLEAAIMCALEKKADDRFQSMAAFGAALGSIAEELDRLAEAFVQATGNRDQTTERDAAGNAAGATMMDPPDARMAELIQASRLEHSGLTPAANVVPAGSRDVHAQDTQALGAKNTDDRSTHILADAALHVQATVMLAPSAPAATPAPTPPIVAPSKIQAVASSEHNQRVAGVSLRDVLGSTGALRQLEQALDQRGAPPPVAPSARAPATDEPDAFLADARRRMQMRILIVALVVVAAMIALAFAIH